MDRARHILCIDLGTSALKVALVSMAGDVVASEQEAHQVTLLLAHILWLKHEEPETYRRAHVFLEPKDWLNARLTGRLAASFDSIALHWVTDNRHPDRIRYDPALLRLAGIEESRLPELLAATDILGPLSPEPAAALGVPAGIPVVVGTPDLQSAAIGSGATRDYQAHVYVGTSSWLTCHVPFKKTDLLHNMASLPGWRQATSQTPHQ